MCRRGVGRASAPPRQAPSEAPLLTLKPPTTSPASTPNRPRGSVPSRRRLTEVRLISHVTRQSSMVPKYGILRYRPIVPYRLEEGPQVRFQLIPRRAVITKTFERGLLAGNYIVFCVPFLQIFLPHRSRKTTAVVTGRFVLAGLRKILNPVLGNFQSPSRTVESVGLRRLPAQIQAKVDRRSQRGIFVKGGMYVWHVAAILPKDDVAEGLNASGRLIDTQHEHHAADQVNQKIAGDPGAVLPPAAPAREIFG